MGEALIDRAIGINCTRPSPAQSLIKAAICR
jgi:hypothetical protein